MLKLPLKLLKTKEHSMSESKNVKFAVLHGTVHTPETGQFGPALAADGTQSKVAKMTLENGYLFVTTKGSPVKKGVTIAVPMANISHFMLAE